MRKPDGIYGAEDRNTIISTLDILMKSQDNKSSEEEKEEKGFLGKFKSKLNRTQTSSKLNPSIKRLKSKLQSLYEEYPPLEATEKMPSTSMPDELRNNENIINFAIKADFLNDAEKLIRDTLSEIYILEKNSLGKDATASKFSDQGKNAIVVLSTLLRQQNQVDGGSERNTYNYQYELMRRVLAMKKESSSYSSSSRSKYGSKNDSYDNMDNVRYMRVLGIALNAAIGKNSNLNENIIKEIKPYAETLAIGKYGELKTGISNYADTPSKLFYKLLNTFRGITSSNENGFKFSGQLQAFLKKPTDKAAKQLLEKCIPPNNPYKSAQCYDDIFIKSTSAAGLDSKIQSNDQLKDLFYKKEDDPANNKQPKTEPAKPTQKEDTKDKK